LLPPAVRRTLSKASGTTSRVVERARRTARCCVLHPRRGMAG
jgi:hypothetical protein